MDRVKDRLLKLVDILENGKHTVFAKKAGIPHSTFQNYVKEGRMPHSEHLIRINKKYSVNINWLLTGEGEMFLNDSSYINPAIEKILSMMQYMDDEDVKYFQRMLKDKLRNKDKIKKLENEVDKLKKIMEG